MNLNESFDLAGNSTKTKQSELKTLEKVKKPIIRKESQAAIKRPENVIRVEQQETSIEQTVEKIRKLINRTYRHNNNQPIDYFKLILNPESFGKTIENMLHVSFLAHDGVIKLTNGKTVYICTEFIFLTKRLPDFFSIFLGVFALHRIS